MMRWFLSLFTLFGLFSTTAQEEFFAISHSGATGYDIRQVYHTVNEKSNEFAIFYADFERLYAVGFDSELRAMTQLQCPFSVRTYVFPLIKAPLGENHLVVLANRNLKKIAYAYFDFKKRQVNSDEVDLDLRDEKYLISFEQQEKPRLLTLSKDSADVILYTFNEDFSIDRTVFDLSQMELFGYAGRRYSANNLLGADKNGFNGVNLDSKKELPNSLGQVISKTKMYIQGDELLITLDFNHNFTQIISLNTLSGESSLRNILKPNGREDGQLPENASRYSKNFAKSNSYLDNDQLTQIMYEKDTIKFGTVDLNTNERLFSQSIYNSEQNDYDLNRFDSKSFKFKPLEAKSFFKRVSSIGRVAVFTEKDDSGTTIKYGSWKYVAESRPTTGSQIFSAAIGGFIGGAVGGALLGLATSEMGSYSYINNGKTYQGISYLDADYQPRQGQVKDNELYNQLREYKLAHKKGRFRLLFKFNSHLVLGLFYFNDNFIDLIKFEDQ